MNRRLGVAGVTLTVLLGVTGLAAARESGIQRTPDGARVLVSKDVGGQRFAITLNDDGDLRSDGTVTGNVYSTDGSAPQFISCAPTGPSAFTCRVAGTCDPSAARESGIQRALDTDAVLVSKDVGSSRFAISQNRDGSLTGNVFDTVTGGAQFLFCQPDGAGYSCALAGSCTTQPCAAQFTTLPDLVSLPATFFTLPELCTPYGPEIPITLPKNFFVPDSEVLSEAARQVIANNPFRTTVVATATQLGKGAAINDVITATRLENTPAQVGTVAPCPKGGAQTLTSCEAITLDAVPATVSTITFDSCAAGSDASGFILQTGSLRVISPNSTSCVLYTAQNLPMGVEISEERIQFETVHFTGPGVRTETDVENLRGLVTHSNDCGGTDPRFLPTSRRAVEGENLAGIATASGNEEFVTLRYDGTGIRSAWADNCDTRVTTLTEGTIAATDSRFGESYVTRFSDLRYTLNGDDASASFTIDGALIEGCTGLERAFSYRTLTPATFDRDGIGCPRGGSFELSAEGEVVGQLSFADTGGVTLTPVSGPPISFASCNDPALRLTVCRAND